MISPPTHNIAAVPITVSHHMNPGITFTIPRPSDRVIRNRPRCDRASPTSSAFTISATDPYTATVIMISIVGFMIQSSGLIDIALIYALISFTATLAVLRFTEYQREMDEREEPEAATEGEA